MQFGAVIVSTILSIVEIFSICIVGGIAAKYEMLDKDKNKVLSKLITNVMFPPLIVVKIAATISPSVLVDWWPIPVFGLFNLFCAFAVSLLAAKVCRPSQGFRRMFVFAATMPNVNSIPFKLIQVVCSEGGALAHIPNAKEMGEAFVSTYIAVSNVFMWTVLYSWYMSGSDGTKKNHGKSQDGEKKLPETNGDISGESSELLETKRNEREDDVTADEESDMEAVPLTSTSTINNDDNDKDNDNNDNNDSNSNNSSGIDISNISNSGATTKASPLHRVINTVAPHIKRILTPAFSSVLIGLLIGMIAPLKHLFFVDVHSTHATPPLSFIVRICDSLGGGAVSGMLLLLGASLVETSHTTNTTTHYAKQDKVTKYHDISESKIQRLVKIPKNFLKGVAMLFKPNSPGLWRSIVGVCAVRLLVMPVIGTVVLMAATKSWHLMAFDPVMLLVLLVEFGTPSNIYVVMLSQEYSTAERHDTAQVMLWCYALSGVTMLLYISFSLYWLLEW